MLHADRLLEHGRIADTVELFRKAGCYKEAANILFQVSPFGFLLSVTFVSVCRLSHIYLLRNLLGHL